MLQHGVTVEKNRFYAGFGYRLTGKTAFQVGWICDTDYKSNYHTAKNFLKVALYYDFTKLFKRQERKVRAFINP